MLEIMGIIIFIIIAVIAFFLTNKKNNWVNTEEFEKRKKALLSSI